jgi:hypothetical protein
VCEKVVEVVEVALTAAKEGVVVAQATHGRARCLVKDAASTRTTQVRQWKAIKYSLGAATFDWQFGRC